MSTPVNWTRHPPATTAVGASAGAGSGRGYAGERAADPGYGRRPRRRTVPARHRSLTRPCTATTATPNQPGAPAGTSGSPGTGNASGRTSPSRGRSGRSPSRSRPGWTCRPRPCGRREQQERERSERGAISRAEPESRPSRWLNRSRPGWTGRADCAKPNGRSSPGRTKSGGPGNVRTGIGPAATARISRSSIRSRPAWTGRPISVSTISAGVQPRPNGRPGSVRPLTPARSRPPVPRRSRRLRRPSPHRPARTSCSSARPGQQRARRRAASAQRGQRAERGQRSQRARAAPGTVRASRTSPREPEQAATAAEVQPPNGPSAKPDADRSGSNEAGDPEHPADQAADSPEQHRPPHAGQRDPGAGNPVPATTSASPAGQATATDDRTALDQSRRRRRPLQSIRT